MDFNTIYNNLLSGNENENPEQKIIKFLNMAGEILSSNLNTQQYAFEFCSVENILSNDNSLTEYWNKTELKEILLSDHEFGNRIEVFVRVILDFIMKQIENFSVDKYTEIHSFAAALNRFLKICENNNIMVIKGCVLKFLAQLFNKIEHINSDDFIKNGSLYQFIAKLIELFKEIEFVQKDILLNINVKVKKIANFLRNKQVNEFYTGICYESLLIYLTILKGVLKYKLIRLFELDENEKTERTISLEIKKNLNVIVDKLPEYVQIIVQECSNLL